LILYLVIIVLCFWELYWKYNALWLAARSSDKGWFFSILIINSLGLLPIYYLHIHGYFDDGDENLEDRMDVSQ
jgi:hypothetical protein